jgi:hypothetical protein
LDQYYDDGNDQQEMDESTTRIAAKKSQQPQNQEYHTDGPKHVRLLSNPALLPHDLFDLADLFLNFAGYPFISTFSFQLSLAYRSVSRPSP